MMIVMKPVRSPEVEWVMNVSGHQIVKHTTKIKFLQDMWVYPIEMELVREFRQGG